MEIPEGLYLRGNMWWTQIKKQRPSTGTSDLKEAKRIFEVRKGKIGKASDCSKPFGGSKG
jgi:hypothetical protein